MPHFKNRTINVVGTYYTGVYHHEYFIKILAIGKKIILEREPNNSYDHNAVAVYLEGVSRYYGYIPRKLATDLAPILDRGSVYDCEIKELRGKNRAPRIIISLSTYPIEQASPSRKEMEAQSRHAGKQGLILTPTGKRFRRISNIEQHINKYTRISGVYVIWNRQNKIYVGSSHNIGERWRNHRSQLFSQSHPNQQLQNDWVQMGADEFRFDLIKEAPFSQLLKEEKFYIEKFDSHHNGYNVTPTGEGILHIRNVLNEHAELAKNIECIDSLPPPGISATKLDNITVQPPPQRPLNESKELPPTTRPPQHDPQKVVMVHNLPQNTAEEGKKNEGSGWKWVVLCMPLLFMAFFAKYRDQKANMPTHFPPPTIQITTAQKNKPVLDVTTGPPISVFSESTINGNLFFDLYLYDIFNETYYFTKEKSESQHFLKFHSPAR